MPFEDLVWMYNEETSGYAQVTPSAFEEAWKETGKWVLKDPPPEKEEVVEAPAAEAKEPEVVLLWMYHDKLKTFAKLPEKDAEAWEQDGWVRASEDPEGNPVAPPEAIQSNTGTDTTADSAEQVVDPAAKKASSA